MRMPSLQLTFFLSIAVGVAATVGYFAATRAEKPRGDIQPLTNDIFVTGQIVPRDVAYLKSRGFQSIIDLRPDGEAADEPTSAQMSTSAAGQRIKFAYVPVPHGTIPDASVDSLSVALKDLPKPVLLYCRSGRRAARTWALSEASRAGGLGASEIAAAVARVGQTTEDIADDIARKTGARAVEGK